jgi:hypothetical protein
MIDNIRELAISGKVNITLHGRHEMDVDMVSTDELLKTLSSSSAEIIEDYPDDPRGHSHLILGQLSNGDSMHICCAVHEDELIIITVYRPSPEIWASDWRTRK